MKERALEDPLEHSSVCGACCTQLEGVSVRLGGRTVLSGIDLHLHCGQLAAIIGPNGAGKTTLLRTLLGELPCSGRIEFRPSTGQTVKQFRIGYVPQRLEFDPSAPVSVRDLFAVSLSRRPLWLGVSPWVHRGAVHALQTVNAENLLTRRVGSLSGGQLQRVLLALALTPIPNLLLLDEPVSGIDPAGMDLFYDMVSQLRRRYHLAIVMVSHDIGATARHADRMLFLDKTIICDDVPDAVVRHPAVVSAFGRHFAGEGPASVPILGYGAVGNGGRS